MPDLPRLARGLLEIALEDVADDATRLVLENDLVLARLDRLNVGFVHMVELVEVRPLVVRSAERVEPRDLVARGPDAVDEEEGVDLADRNFLDLEVVGLGVAFDEAVEVTAARA